MGLLATREKAKSMYYKLMDHFGENAARISINADDMIRDLALDYWSCDMDPPPVGVYMTDYGAIEIIPLTEKEVKRLYKRRKKRAQKDG